MEILEPDADLLDHIQRCGIVSFESNDWQKLSILTTRTPRNHFKFYDYEAHKYRFVARNLTNQHDPNNVAAPAHYGTTGFGASPVSQKRKSPEEPGSEPTPEAQVSRLDQPTEQARMEVDSAKTADYVVPPTQ